MDIAPHGAFKKRPINYGCALTYDLALLALNYVSMTGGVFFKVDVNQ